MTQEAFGVFFSVFDSKIFDFKAGVGRTEILKGKSFDPFRARFQIPERKNEFPLPGDRADFERGRTDQPIREKLNFE